jgi:hypothetical protein
MKRKKNEKYLVDRERSKKLFRSIEIKASF